MKKTFLILIISVLTACSQSDDIDLEENDYLIFGHFYGECLGESCVETFKLTDTKLFEDTNDHYSTIDDFSFQKLDNEKFILIEDLIDYFPSSLLEEEEVIGCPDCGDWGGLFIQYSKDNLIKSWRIDQMKDNVPENLHAFIDKVNEKIALINN